MIRLVFTKDTNMQDPIILLTIPRRGPEREEIKIPPLLGAFPSGLSCSSEIRTLMWDDDLPARI